MAEVLYRADRVLELGRQAQQSLRELLGELAAFDRSNEWMVSAASCAQWLAESLDMSLVTAREWLRISHKLAGVPLIAKCYAAREISFSKVRALTRLATAANEAELLAIAKHVSANDLPDALAGWLARNETPEQRDRRERAATGLTVRKEPDGMRVITLRLPALPSGIVMAAIDAAAVRSVAQGTYRASAEFPSVAQQRADAFVRLANEGGSSVLTEVVVHVRGDGCTLDDGSPLADHDVARLLPGAFVRLLIIDAKRRPVNVSMRRRFPTSRQKRFVKARDRKCVACGAALLLNYHHVPGYDETRHTHVDELELRCVACHRNEHQVA